MAEWPYPFYVCGERMPRFGAMWHWVYVAPEVDVHDHQVDIRVQDVLYSIDHEYDSEDAGVVEICANQVLLTLMEYWDQHIEAVQGHLAKESALSGQEIDVLEVLENLRDTLFRTIEMTRQHPVVWWTNCEPGPQFNFTQERIQQALAFAGDSLDSPWPHRACAKSRIESQRTWNRADLHRLAQSGRFDKETRTRLLEL